MATTGEAKTMELLKGGVIEAAGTNSTRRATAVEDLLTRVVENLIGRVSGPMKFQTAHPTAHVCRLRRAGRAKRCS